MKKIPITLKIISIFLVPVLALFYFSYYFIEKEYNNLNESAKYKLASNIVGTINEFTHNIQIERGLSVGYIVAEDKTQIKKQLIKQHIKTNKTYTKFLKLNSLKSKAKKDIEKKIALKNRRRIKNVIYQWSKIQTTRENILSSAMNFDNIILYYSKINTQLMHTIDSYLLILKDQNSDEMALSKLEYLKENAGLERAYIYNSLLSKDIKNIEMIQELQRSQYLDERAFKLNASLESTALYSQILQQNTTIKIDKIRKLIHNNSPEIASSWFKYSSERINMLDTIIQTILNSYITKADKVYSTSLNSLYLTAILWFISLLSLSMLTFILRKMVFNEEKFKEELRIAAYTFDSHEAMAITDLNGTILRVNDGFTRITGYSRQEVIGENPRVLKSMKHSEDFYKEMWRQLHANGKWSDEIYNMRKNGEIYLENLSITAIKNEKDITTHYIAQFLDISDLKNAQEEAQHQADHDFSTGLANRRYLTQRLNDEFTKAKKYNFLHAFLFVDLDDFKKINDKYGHNTGDKLIQEVTLRLKSQIKKEDLASRMSGDEFAIVLLNLDNNETKATKQVHEICANILSSLNEGFVINKQEIQISSSIGIKLFPQEEKDIDNVIIHADTAMYQAKNKGKNQFRFFDKTLEIELKQLSLMEDEIKHGLKNSEFKLYYQPKINVKDGTIYGAELLSRWEHPSKGILYPGSFIKIASDIGVLHEFTQLALHAACQFIKENGTLIQGSLAININSKELLDSKFNQDVINTINHYKINPHKIELEITEDELIKNFDLALSRMLKLQEFGVKFAIDDFGTGYSSITYLNQLPVDTLKIDRTFLLNLNTPESQELLNTIVKLAHIFKMDIVAEGIEDKAQLDFIKANGTELYQGYYFSKAIPEDDFIKMLRESN